MSNPKIREDEIRPDHLIEEQTKRFQADTARILARKSEFVKVSCPACASEMNRSAFQKNDIDYVLCADCETMFVNPRPTPAVLEMYYSSSENYAFWNTHIFPHSENVRREKIFKPRAERVASICKKYGVRRKLLLEVGAGFGTFCEELRNLGAFESLLAVEPTPGLAETCRSRGINVIEKPIESVELEDGMADVVACFEVIEHLFDPSEFIKQCARILTAGGLFIATCPNVKGFDIDTLQAHSGAVDPEHLNYFHPRSLSLLLSSCGFTVLEVQTPGQLDAELVRKKVLSGEFSLSEQPFLQQVLVKEWERLGDPFQDFLSQNCLSSHMWIVAQKL